MKVLVTGASGWIGSASVAELVKGGHEVIGLARSDEAAAKITALGIAAIRGSLDDLDSLRAAAKGVGAVVHLGYNHDFSQMEAAARTDRAAIDTFADVLQGTGASILMASGTLGLRKGSVSDERDSPDPAAHPRGATSTHTLGLASRGLRPIVMRFAPTVHGAGGDHGFVATLARIAREKGVAAYIGEGRNRWPAVHRLDAAALVRLAIEKVEGASVFHAIAEEGIEARTIAEALGAHLKLPVASVPADRAMEHFGWMGMFFGADIPASSDITRKALGWAPQHDTLLQDIAAGHYPGN